jgi:hypothetical protein
MRLIRSFNWCNQYGIDKVEVVLSDNVATINNSYKIKKLSHMIDVVKWLKTYDKPVTQQSLFIMVAEWRAHNLLYWLNIEKDRTAHVDINLNNWKMKLAYAVVSIFYFGQ